MENELWKPIKNYEGLYEVSSLGRIKRLKGKTKRKDGLYNVVSADRILTPIISEGYLKVSLWKGNEGLSFYVHVLVAIAFVGNPDKKSYVNHKD